MNCDFCVRSSTCMFEEGARAYEKRLEIKKDQPALIHIMIKCEKFIPKERYSRKNVKEASAAVSEAAEK